MLIGFGCSVPAILSTRTLASERDRKMTILLTPFMSCSAKLPIYGVFTMAFFPKYRALVMISLYVIGMFVGILSGCLLYTSPYSPSRALQYRPPTDGCRFRLPDLQRRHPGAG